jgi:hypothetical protein
MRHCQTHLFISGSRGDREQSATSIASSMETSDCERRNVDLVVGSNDDGWGRGEDAAQVDGIRRGESGPGSGDTFGNEGLTLRLDLKYR